MIIFEIVAGVAILLGWRMQLFSWLLLLLIIFFTFLTGYAVLSGKIRTCGCFGDCIPLTATQSFTKDLVLTALIVFIFIYRNRIRPIFSSTLSIAMLLVAFIAAGLFQASVLKHLPIVDCLGYKKNKDILAQMKVASGAIPDSTVINFVYEKQGKPIEFTAENFPDDFSEDTYKFVRRYDKLVRKGNAEPPIRDFALQTAAGNDTTQAFLSQPGYKILFFMRDLPTPPPAWASNLAPIYNEAAKRSLPMVAVSSDFNSSSAWLNALQLQGVPVLKCDYVAIKTAARSDATLYLLKDATIINKWAGADLDQALSQIQKLQ